MKRLFLLIVVLTLPGISFGEDTETRVLRAQNKMLQANVTSLREEVQKLRAEVLELQTRNRKLLEAIETMKPPTSTTKPVESPKPVGPPQQAVELKDQWEGFRGLKWGCRVPGGMIETDVSGNVRTYSRKGDKLSIGAAKLMYITYGFYKGRLWAVMIKVDGYSNGKHFRDAVLATYGGAQPNEFIDSWLINSPDKRVLGGLAYNEVDETTTLALYYEPLAREKAADQAKAAKEAAKDF